MRKIQISLLLAAVALLAINAGPSKAQGVAEQWVPLGCKKVAFTTDHDAIRVGRRDGRFRAIRLKAHGNDVFMEDLKVVYGNGAPDDIHVRSAIRSGTSSGKLDLRGFDRAIDRIELRYRSRPNSRGQAELCADGLLVVAGGPPPGAPVVVVVPPPGGGGGGNWVNLGCKRVSFGADRDIVQVGSQPGGFRAIRLKVMGNEIFMYDLKVVYGQGPADDIPVKAAIRAGSTSGRLDLKGDRRQIRRVEMIYRSRPSFRGEAQVCVEGTL